MSNRDVNSPSLLDTYSLEKVPRTAQVSWLTFFVVTLFGIGSWIAINGVLIELPVIVNSAPEGWKLPSYIVVICQLANVGPLVYSIGRRYYPKHFHERPAIYAILIIGTTSCVCLSLFWHRTSHVLGQQRSTALLACTFLVAIVDCTSTVTFLPFMALLPELYMSSLYVGENLSGLVPSLFALIQGAEGSQAGNSTAGNASYHIPSANRTDLGSLRFSQGVYFSLLAVMMVICMSAFTLINFLPSIRTVHVRDYSSLRNDFRAIGNSEESLLHHDLSQVLHSCSYREGKSCCSSDSDDDAGNLFMSFREIAIILAIQFWINVLSNGVIASIQAYACEPYGNLAYHLAASLGNIAAALACFGFLWFPCKSMRVIIVGGLLYTAISFYITFVAVSSPNPLLKDHVMGKILIVTAFVVSNVFVSYTKLAICTVMRELSHKHLFWCGMTIQFGSFLGAVVTFPIVNFGHIFKSK